MDIKKEIEKAVNTAKVNAKAVECINKMKDFTDIEIIATGVIISKITKTHMDRAGK